MTENPTEKALFRDPCDNGAQGLPRCGECPSCLGRVALTRPPAGDGEAVAWMYTDDETGSRYVVSKRDDKAFPYLPATPLYAHPPTTPNSGAEDGVTQGERDIVAQAVAVHFARRPWLSMATDSDIRALKKSHGLIPPIQDEELTIEGAYEAADRIIAEIARHRLTSANTASEREKALEEAAKVADDHALAWGLAHSTPAIAIANAIRSLSHTKEG